MVIRSFTTANSHDDVPIQLLSLSPKAYPGKKVLDPVLQVVAHELEGKVERPSVSMYNSKLTPSPSCLPK